MTFTATPITEELGATVAGVTRGDVATEQVARRVLEALDRHGVLVFPELHIDDTDLAALSRLLGHVVVPPHGALPDHPEISPIARDPGHDRLARFREGTFFWHLDGTSYDAPDKATLLTALRTPDGGEGDTEFASTYAAYEALPRDERARIDGLGVRHSFANSQRLVHPDPTPEQVAAWAEVPAREHPLVWRRRDGRRSLVIGATAEAIVGWPDDEGRALLDRLLDWVTQPRFTLRHSWREGDLVIWDNTGLLHRALPYGAGSPRLMHRTTLAGEEAFA